MSTTITVNGFEVEVFDFKNNSYAYIPNGSSIYWSVAKNQAEGVFFEGVAGHLATITSAEENIFIVENILPFAPAEVEVSGWLGGTDEETEGQWKWITGETWNYTNWYSGQPNNAQGDQHYLYISGTAEWNDYPIYAHVNGYDNMDIHGYIIEFEGTGGIDDNLVGTNKNDTLDGRDGEDNLIGAGGNDLLKGGTGDDVLIGGMGNDTLDGGFGKDVMIGGLGNDVYSVDSLGDIIIEKATGGIDLVKASLNYTLDNNIENLTLIGTKDLNGSGNNLNNIITGNNGNNTIKGEAGNDKLLGGKGNDTLIGGLGKDTLTGGTGADQFMFESKAHGVDTITDFNNIADKIAIKASGFGGGLKAGNLSAEQFVIGGVGTVASSASHRFIYNSDGKLFFDADGNGNAAQIQIAIFNNPPFLSNNNFVII